MNLLSCYGKFVYLAYTLYGKINLFLYTKETGHDSYEDAAACMQLMKWKVVEDLKKEARKTGQVVCSWTKSS